MFQLLYFILSMVILTSGLPFEGRSRPDLLAAGETQYHNQDSKGLYDYGYSNGESSRQESRSLDGVTKGSYSYVDSEGVLQNVVYQADAENGFRVSGTNLPVASVTPDHASITTPAFTSLLKTAIKPENVQIPSTTVEELKDADNVDRKQENHLEIITIEPTKDQKNAIVHSQIPTKTTDKSNFLPSENDSLESIDKGNNIEMPLFLPNNEFKGYFMFPLSQTNPLYPPYSFNPFGYSNPQQNPEDLQNYKDIQGHNRFGLLPVLQQNSYPFLGRNFDNNYNLITRLVPLFEIENSGLDYARIQLLHQYYNGAYHNLKSSWTGEVNGLSIARAFPYLRHIRPY